jgi:hypothetical protein
MREASIILPCDPTEKRLFETEHRHLAAKLANHFGGFTVTEGKGGWIDPSNGKTIYDDVRVYTVAMEPTPANDRLLDDLVIVTAKMLRQKAVYVRHASGEVCIFDLDKE